MKMNIPLKVPWWVWNIFLLVGFFIIGIIIWNLNPTIFPHEFAIVFVFLIIAFMFSLIIIDEIRDRRKHPYKKEILQLQQRVSQDLGMVNASITHDIDTFEKMLKEFDARMGFLFLGFYKHNKRVDKK